MSEYSENLSGLVRSIIDDEHPKKTWLLQVSRGLKNRGQTVLQYPGFNLFQYYGSDGKLFFSRTDALNILMVYAGNDETGNLREGAIIEEVQKNPEVINNISRLIDRLKKMPQIEYESPNLFLNSFTSLTVSVPKDLLIETNNVSNKGNAETLAEGFIVPINVAVDVIKQITDQLLDDYVIDQYEGMVISGDGAGLRGIFYDSEDAAYLVKMLYCYLPRGAL